MSGGEGTGVQAARDAGGVEDTESQRGSNNVQHGPEEADPDVPEDVPEHDDQDVQLGSYRTVSYQKEKVSSSENTTLFKRNQ